MKRTYLNIDPDTVVHPFLKRICERDDFCEEMLYPMVDTYQTLGVTDLVFNTFGQLSITESSVFTDSVSKYLQKEENGKSVNYEEIYKNEYIFYKHLKTDIYDVWFKRCYEVGINPWMSIRMNDCHLPFDDTSEFRSDFYYKAHEKGMVLGDDYGYFKICYDYSFKEVRDIMLEYIREQISRYDVFGLELDFMREPKCFKYLTDDMKKCTELLNDFILNVRDLHNEAENLHGHKIKLSVRVPRDIRQCNMLGFDPETWDKNKVVDLIIPTPRFNSNDSLMPISDWKKKILCAEVCAGIETLTSFKDYIPRVSSAEIISGLAASFLAQGSDGIYLFNLFIDPDNIVEPQIHPYIRNVKAISAVASSNIYEHRLRFAVLNQEDNYIPGNAEKTLPIILDNGKKTLSVCTGDIPANKLIWLIIGFEKHSPNVYFNGIKIDNCKKVDLAYIPGIGIQPENYVDNETICVRYNIPSNYLKRYSQEITFECTCECKINWIEIDSI